MTKDEKVIDHRIATVNEEGKNLTKWELDFNESNNQQFLKRCLISDKQETILEKNYAEKTP